MNAGDNQGPCAPEPRPGIHRERSTHPERELVSAARSLTWEGIPDTTKTAVKRLFLDWVGSALAGASSDPVRTLEWVLTERSGLDRTSTGVGARAGGATILTDLGAVAPLHAALVNAAASHVVEMDDLHNSSIYHPGTCVFPALLAAAEAAAASPDRFLTAAVAGYEVSIRLGEALGPEHYVYFHTTGTAGTIGAAVAVAHLLDLDEQPMLWALGNAATQAAGLWQFLAEGSMSKQLHTAKAAYNGMLAAYLAERGFNGPEHGLCGERGLLAATSPAGAIANGGVYDAAPVDAQYARLLAGLRRTGTVPGTGAPAFAFADFRTPGVSIKYHASCRHTHPPVDALLALMEEQGLDPEELGTVTAHLYTPGYELLKHVVPSSPWAAKFSLPFCLAQAALLGHLSLAAFTEEALADPRVVSLMERVSVQPDPELDAGYPRHWSAWVEVETTTGARFVRRVNTPKGDPENPVTDDELGEKFRSLAGRAFDGTRVERLLGRLWAIESAFDMTGLFADIPPGDRS